MLVTAGATRNPIDAMRFVSAYSSGRTGGRIAGALAADAPVTLMGSPEALLQAPEGVGTTPFGSTRDLMARMEAWVRAHPDGVVVHAAAVGDYEAEPLDEKIPSGLDELVVRLRPAPKILDRIRGWSEGVYLASFKAAPPGTTQSELVRIARAQLERTRSDLVFANALGSIDRNVLLVDPAGHIVLARREDAIDELVRRIRAVLRSP